MAQCSPLNEKVKPAVELPKSADDPEIQPGSEFGARLALADLLSDSLKKRDDARAAYADLSWS